MLGCSGDGRPGSVLGRITPAVRWPSMRPWCPARTEAPSARSRRAEPPALLGRRNTQFGLGVLRQLEVRLQHRQVLSGVSLHRRVAARALFLSEYGDGRLVATDGDLGERDVQSPALLVLDLSHDGFMVHAA